MSLTINLRPVLDRKVWEPCAPCPTTVAAGSFLVDSPATGEPNQYVLAVFSNTVAYFYNPRDDAWSTLTSPALAGTFGNGACGCWKPGGPTGTISAATSTTITTNFTSVRTLPGYMVRITGGTGAGQERAISTNTIGSNAVFTVDSPWGTNPDNTSTFELRTGRFFVIGAGTLASGSFKYYDVATSGWSAALSITGLAASLATECSMIGPGPADPITKDSGTASSGAAGTITDSTKSWTTDQWIGFVVRIVAGTGVGQHRVITANTSTVLTVAQNWTTTPDNTSAYQIETYGLARGKATSGAATTLTNSGKSWTTNQWANYQVRIVAGVGAGQVRTVISNTSTALTVATWTTNPDSTSVYVLEGNDNDIYLFGNVAVTAYRYSISGNSWATLSPGVARGAATNLGCMHFWAGEETSDAWNDETNFLNGRRIYGTRGGGASTIDYYDIALNTWTNAITYGPSQETYTTGSAGIYRGGKWYTHKDATGRYFVFQPTDVVFDGWSNNVYPQGAAATGQRMFAASYEEGGQKLRYIYHMSNSLTLLWRCLDF